MENSIYKVIKGAALTSLSAFVCILNPLSAAQGAKDAKVEVANSNWQEFHSVGGKCKMRFPKSPDHLSEKMRLPEEGFDLKYDAYISAIDQKTVFMLLIAQYPEFVDESYARMSLEGFLNGILTHNPNNQLIFADLSLVEGHEALDFFIRTGGVYFKGRALMVKNSLYLMAMECEVQNYDENNYNTFVNSFKLNK
ncbi:MAG: hypothetical protein JSR39_06710 [Verrucomicrobia bacterium]|nr:hypothetical protein [Verrucomicrobiota bacterium]